MTSFALRATFSAAALIFAASAHATVDISSGNIHFSSMDDYDWNMTPLAAVLMPSLPGQTKIALTSFQTALTYPSAEYSGGDIHNGIFNLNVQAGYRITGISFSGNLAGELLPGQVPQEPGYDGTPGTATNSSGFSMRIGSGAWNYDQEKSAQFSNVNGNQSFSLNFNNLNLTGNHALELGASVFYESTGSYWTFASGDVYYPGYTPSFAGISVLNPTLTVYTAPVPEPETWGMMLAGLGALGWMARRRRAA